jgi:disulfide bond formation protein DsbB
LKNQSGNDKIPAAAHTRISFEETLTMTRVFHLSITFFLISIFGLTACGGSQQADEAAAPIRDGDAPAGQEIFDRSCSACHGLAGEGVAGLGKPMATSEFIAGQSDQELVAFLKVGRDPSDPLNTTGVSMPPKGGNLSLSEQDLYDIVAYLRTLQ